MHLKWTRRALSRLEAIARQIEEDGRPQTAKRLMEKIHAKVKLLLSQPLLGREGRVAGTRELVISGTPLSCPLPNSNGNH